MMTTNRNSLTRVRTLAAAALGIASIWSSSAHAVYSSVNAPPSGEKSVAQILGNTYTGTFALQPNGRDYANGSGVVATRIEDIVAGGTSTNLINLPTGNRDDQLWSDGIAHGTAQARWAGYNQKFGYIDGWSGGSYHNLFDVTGSGYAVSGQTDIDFGDVLGNPAHWRWARAGDGGTWSSLDSDNGAAGFDHMVTYLVTGVNDVVHSGQTTWMLFWEDLNLGDADYNDLAVEITAHAKEIRQNAPGATPEPATAALALCSLGGLAMSITRRRKATATEQA